MKEVLASLYNYIPGYKKTTQYVMKNENKKFLVFTQQSLQQSKQIDFCLMENANKHAKDYNRAKNKLMDNSKINNTNFNISFNSNSVLGKKTVHLCVNNNNNYVDDYIQINCSSNAEVNTCRTNNVNPYNPNNSELSLSTDYFDLAETRGLNINNDQVNNNDGNTLLSSKLNFDSICSRPKKNLKVINLLSFTLTGCGSNDKDYFTYVQLTKHFSLSLLEEVTKLNKNIQNLQDLIISMKK